MPWNDDQAIILREPWGDILRHSWDRVIQSLLMITFGVLSTVITARDPAFGWAHAVYIGFCGVFVFIGIAGVIVLRTGSRRLRLINMIAFVSAMTTFATLLLFFSQGPFALLIYGLGMAGLTNARMVHRQEAIGERVQQLVQTDRQQPDSARDKHRHRLNGPEGSPA